MTDRISLDAHRAMPATPMRLTDKQRQEVYAWLLSNCTGLMRPHTSVYMANHVAPILGYTGETLDYEVLHPLCATMRSLCKHLDIPIRKLVRDDEGLGSTIKPAKPRTKCCTVCGQPFRTPAGNRKKCDKCRSAERARKLPPRRCDECEREYQPKVHNSKYCSELCAGIAENKRRRAQRAAKSNSDE